MLVPELPDDAEDGLPLALREAQRIEAALAEAHGNTFPPTKASTVARSSGFHEASPIRALVSPR